MESAKDQDKLLVQAVLDGDYAAFETLVDKYGDRLYLTGLRMCGDPDVAEEMVQETFYRAYRSLAQFRGESRFFTWMFSIARNVCMAHFREENARPDAMSLDSPASAEADESDPSLQVPDPDSSVSPEDALLRGELRDRLIEAVFVLPHDQRLAFILRDLQGLSYNEVAQAMDKSLGAVKTDIRRARIKLRELLAPYIVA